ncbi:uncharacterized protein [Spinacia oleracea]|uniref:Uncharacterized protein n=1 Tax=Spinacia oleracea TaxID=3562 RepID=A0ABM3RNC9_SPIOL|nr:uncharacterized protein LOC130470633 [Spinacia oleracea]
MGYVEIQQWVFALERGGCVVFLCALLLGTFFNNCQEFVQILLAVVALTFLTTNLIFFLPGFDDVPGIKYSEKPKEEQLLEKQKLVEQLEECEEEKQKLVEQLEEYTSEIKYHRKLSKLEERFDKLEQQQQKHVVKEEEEDVDKLKEKCKKLEEEKEELLIVVEEFKNYQQLWEQERSNNTMFIIDNQINITQDYKELLNKQNDMMLKVISMQSLS